MNGESLRLVTLGGGCFEAAPRGVVEPADRDGLLYKFHLADMVSNRGTRLVSVFASGTLGVIIVRHRSHIPAVCLNAIRRAFDNDTLSFDAPFDEGHYTELPLLESDFQTQRARTDSEIRQYIIHKAYWLAYRFPMQRQPTDVLYPIPFDDNPADLDYLGVTSNEVRSNIQRLANQGLLEKVLEGNARPTEKLLSQYESGQRSGLGLSPVDSTAAQFEDGGPPMAGRSTPELRSAIPAKELSRKVFVVHGHDEGARETVARFLERLGFEAIILHEQASRGRTVIEKVEAHGDVGFAVVLLTPDDEGCLKGGTPKPRARQNVLLELGYFVGRLGRNRVCALKRGEVEIPSDFEGVVYVPFDDSGAWKQALGRELEAAAFEIDWNKLMRP